jgi:subtilase family serine protease
VGHILARILHAHRCNIFKKQAGEVKMKKIGTLAIISIMLSGYLLVTTIPSEVKGAIAKPDLEVIEVSMDDYNIKRTGEWVNVYVTIRNNGASIPSGKSFDVSIFIDSLNNFKERKWISDGMPGNGYVRTVTFPGVWIKESLGKHTMIGYVDHQGKIDEYNEGNNRGECSFKVTITGTNE